MSEAQMRRTLVKALKPLHAISIESPITGIGIPDINYAGGWIECKYMKNWPKGCMTNPVKFHHTLSKEQKIWLYKRAQTGELTLVAAQVARSWFFFCGMEMFTKWDTMSRPTMEEIALLHCPNGLQPRKLLDFLQHEPSTCQRRRYFYLPVGGATPHKSKQQKS
jgi:hypothetical protein